MARISGFTFFTFASVISYKNISFARKILNAKEENRPQIDKQSLRFEISNLRFQIVSFACLFICGQFSVNIKPMKAVLENNLPPSVKPSLFGGHFMQFRRQPTEFLQKLAALGDITSFRMGSQQAFLINHPDFVRDVLVTNHSKFHKGRALKRAKKLLGEGLLTGEGESHLRQRRMIQPAFHRQRIAGYAETMIEFAEKMANAWREGEVRDLSKEMMHLTLQIVGKTLFNAQVEDEADEVGAAMTTLVEL